MFQLSHADGGTRVWGHIRTRDLQSVRFLKVIVVCKILENDPYGGGSPTILKPSVWLTMEFLPGKLFIDQVCPKIRVHN